MATLPLLFALALGNAPPSVQVTVVGAEDRTGVMASALPEFVDEWGLPAVVSEATQLDLEEILDPAEPPSPAPARVWIDVTRPGTARIIIVDEAYERVLIRKVTLEADLDEVAQDEIGYIVESSVEALLAGGRIGVAREDAAEKLGVSPQPTAPTPTPDPGPRPSVTVAAGYGARAWGPVAPLHGPALVARADSVWSRASVGGSVEGQYLLPVDASGDPLTLRLEGASVRGLVRAGVRFRDPWLVDFGLGGGVDLLNERARVTGETGAAFTPQTRPVGVATARVGPAVRLGSGRDRVELKLEIGVDVAVRSFRYVTADGGSVLLDPWVARPGLSFTVGWVRGGFGAGRPGSDS